MLARLDPRHLARIRFPLGAQTKDETRAEAAAAGLAAARPRREPGGVLPRRRRLPLVPRPARAAGRGRRDRRRGGAVRSASTTATGGSRPGSAAASGSRPPSRSTPCRPTPRTNTVVVGPRASLARTQVSARGRLFAPVEPGDREAPLPLARGRRDGRADRRRISGSSSTSRPTAWPAARRPSSTTATPSSVPGWSRRPRRASLHRWSSPSPSEISLISRWRCSSSLSASGFRWAFLRLAVTFDRLSSLIRGAEREVLPVINKVGGSVDRVNVQLDKLDTATDSAVDAVEAVDEAVRAVSFAVKRPVQKLAGFSAGRLARLGVTQVAPQLARRRRGGQGRGRAARARSRRRAEVDRMADEITLTLPRAPEFQRVAHLVLGGLAVRLNLTVESLEDLQLALDAVLDRLDPATGEVTVRMSLRDGELETLHRPAPAASCSTRSSARPTATSSACAASSTRPSTTCTSTESGCG